MLRSSPAITSRAKRGADFLAIQTTVTAATDAVRLLHPDARIYTFWKYFRNAFARDAGLRIDHFLLSPSLRERLLGCGVDKFVQGWEHTSDHAPVWIELDDG